MLTKKNFKISRFGFFFSFLALIQMAYVCFGQNFTAILFKIVSLIDRATNQFY